MTETTNLVNAIIKGIQEKKGQDIVIADLSHIDGAIAKSFVICQGNSPSQVEAIAESISEVCRKELKEKPVGVNGLGANQWVAIDFVDVLVHIFVPELRTFYDLENLWEDAKLTRLPNIDSSLAHQQASADQAHTSISNHGKQQPSLPQQG